MAWRAPTTYRGRHGDSPLAVGVRDAAQLHAVARGPAACGSRGLEMALGRTDCMGASTEREMARAVATED